MSKSAINIRNILRLEGALVTAVAVHFYAQSGASWWLFALLVLVPDISMVGYLKDRELGSKCYNAGHTYLGPAVLWAVLELMNTGLAGPLALIWIVHIGADRLLGYGLKHPGSFKQTHLSA